MIAYFSVRGYRKGFNNNKKDTLYLVSSKFKLFYLSLLHDSTATSVPGLPYFRGCTITLRHTNSVELLWASDQHRPLPDNTQHSQETDMNVPDGIRSRNPSKRAAVDRHLRPRPLRSVTLSHYVIVIILSLTNVVLYEYC